MNPKLVGVFLLLMGVILTPTSLIELKDRLSNPAPTPIAFAAFNQDLPDEGWFKISGAQLEISEALYVDEDGKVGNIYVPARASGSVLHMADEPPPITVLVRISNAADRKLVEAGHKAQKSEAAATQFFLRNIDKLQVERVLQGTIAGGLDSLDEEDKRALQAANANLSDDFVILQEGVKPSVAGRVWMLIFAIGLSAVGAVFLFNLRERRNPRFAR